MLVRPSPHRPEEVPVTEPTPLSRRAAWIICAVATLAVLGGVTLSLVGQTILGPILFVGGLLYLWLTIRQRRAIRRYERWQR